MTAPDVHAPPLTSSQIMVQQWCDLAFLHWFVPPERVSPHLPPGVAPDVLTHGAFAGLTPVALVPFRMVGAGVGSGPAIPYFGTFWETNVRLYSVDATGRRGVVFSSLDASRLAVVLGARFSLGLPYRFSRMRGYQREHLGAREFGWTTRTRWPGPSGIQSRIVIRTGEVLHAFTTGRRDETRGSTEDLAAFLTARWGLHTSVFGRTLYVPNQHEPWTLRAAEVLLLDDGLLAAAGFGELAGRPPDHVCYAEGVRTTFGFPRSNR